MANADVIAKIAGAMWLQDFYQSNVWPMLSMDVSADIPGYGDRIEIPSDNTAYATNALHSITAANLISETVADHQWTAPIAVTAGKVDLILDKQYDLNVLIGTVLQRRVRPSFMASAMFHSARVFREKFNADVRGALDAAAAGQQLTPVATTAANFGNDAHKTEIIKTLRDAKEAADYAHWPRGMDRYCVVSPAYHDIITDYLVSEKLLLVQGATDRAVIEGDVMRFQSWTILMDDSLPEGKTADDDANHTMYFINRGQGFAFAQELRTLRVIDSEVYRGQLLQGIMTHGMVITRPSKIRIAKANIT